MKTKWSMLLSGVLLLCILMPTPARAAGSGHIANLESWLKDCPVVEEHIVWVTGDGKRQPYADWTPAMKSRLGTFYRKLGSGGDLGMHLPTVDKISPTGNRAFFTAQQAFDVYAAHVAHILYVEANHKVPWSIQKRPGAELDQLLGSSSYFARIKPSGDQYPEGIEAGRDFAEAPENWGLGEFLGDPRIGYDFLSGKSSATHRKLIGQTELDTLVNLTLWLRDNVGHGPIDNQRNERAKSHRWLDERLRASEGFRYAVAIQGCHSASKLMVDLARSVNIPLLHTRALDNDMTDGKGNFFNRTHGGLVYGWGGDTPRIVWHTDEIYARPGKVCFPLDGQTGKLAEAEVAARRYFDEMWLSPETLAKAGFVYRLELVTPGKGYAKQSRGKYEDRLDYGMMIGYWKKKGDAKLDRIFDLSLDYALCGAPFLKLEIKHGVKGQVTSNLKKWRGDFTDEELPMLRSIPEYTARADEGLKAIGGAEKLEQLTKDYESNQGKDLLPPAAKGT